MVTEKEKSAVGVGAPATESRKISTDKSITVSDEKIKGKKMIKAVIQHTGALSEISEIENSIEAVNRIVGGLSTEVTIPENGLKLIMNVNSKRKGNPNLKTLWGRIFGTVIIAAKEQNGYVSLTPEQIQSARGWLLKHTWEA